MDTSAEEQLHKAMMDTYHLNLLFLSEFDNELFIRISHLSELIGKGEYKERYFLEFINESADFDIYDSSKEAYLYDRIPKKFNNKAVVQTNYDLKNSINTLHTGFYNHENNGQFETEGDDNIFSVAVKKFMNDFYPLKKELNYKVEREHKRINSIEKFMFVGTLLGRHIPKIMKKINAKTFFVCENNLEIFRLSLFVCDYSAMAINGKQVVFSIMDDEDIFMNKFLYFFNTNPYSNAILKYYSTDYNVSTLFDRIIDRVLSVNPMSFNYYMHLDNVTASISKNFFKYKTLNLNNLRLNSFENKSILYLGVGPSLSDNIQWVKENQDRFVIVTMAASLDILYKNDIKPDIVTTLDPQLHVETQFFSNSKSKELLKDAIVLASINTHDSVLEKLSKITNVYLYEVLSSIQSNDLVLRGNSVGEITYTLISNFINIKDIYLLGLDMSLNQDTGSTHSSEYKYSSELQIDNFDDNLIKEDYSYRGSTIKVKGNLRREVITSRLYYASLRFFNAQAKISKIKTYNLSNHGAFIHNTIPLSTYNINIEDIREFNKSLLKEDLSKDFDLYVTKKFNLTIIENLENHISLVNKLVEELINSKLKTYEELNTFANEIFQIISDDRSKIKFLREIYVTYSLAFIPYISYCLLIKDKKEKINIKKIIKIWQKKLIDLLIIYKEYVENLILANNSLSAIENTTK